MIGFGLARGSTQLADRHLFSLYLMLPLIGVCLGLLKHNWCVSRKGWACSHHPVFVLTLSDVLLHLSPVHRYPARSFIGDTFCYFSGMAFAVVGILGHFSKTLLLFFIPQIFNFLYSTPQLFPFLPCPRHRLPRFNLKTGLLEPSFFVLPQDKRTKSVKVFVGVLAGLRLVEVKRDGKGEVEACSNLTILNLILVVRGSMREDTLCKNMLGLQVVGSLVAFGVRYGVAGWFYDRSSGRM